VDFVMGEKAIGDVPCKNMGKTVAKKFVVSIDHAMVSLEGKNTMLWS
jgi:hypothetical protein